MPRLLRVLWVLEEREEDDSLTTHACKAKARILTANLERALGGGGGVLALVDCAKNVLEALQRLSESDYDAVIVPVYSTAHDLFFDEVGDLIHDMADPVAVFFFRGVGAMKQKSNDDVEERLRAHRAAVAAAEGRKAAVELADPSSVQQLTSCTPHLRPHLVALADRRNLRQTSRRPQDGEPSASAPTSSHQPDPSSIGLRQAALGARTRRRARGVVRGRERTGDSRRVYRRADDAP